MASGAMDRLQENATKYYGQGMKGAEKMELKLEKAIGNNPIASLLIAAGIGVVAGAFWNRK
ncbi:MAG: hypothetical protein IPJ69_12750 [Deltaproteobacteria bacterium]|nr:MAG: hypothetical protein IPJ69_12750 [Deltaproteobacteria bacterium]